MKTNVNKFQSLYNMQLHKAEKISELFDKCLVHGYTNEVLSRALKVGIEANSQTIRNVRSGLGVANLPVLNLIIEVAKEKEAADLQAQEKFKNLTTTI